MSIMPIKDGTSILRVFPSNINYKVITFQRKYNKILNLSPDILKWWNKSDVHSLKHKKGAWNRNSGLVGKFL